MLRHGVCDISEHSETSFTMWGRVLSKNTILLTDAASGRNVSYWYLIDVKFAVTWQVFFLWSACCAVNDTIRGHWSNPWRKPSPTYATSGERIAHSDDSLVNPWNEISACIASNTYFKVGSVCWHVYGSWQSDGTLHFFAPLVYLGV